MPQQLTLGNGNTRPVTTPRTNTNSLLTHVWEDRIRPHQITQDGEIILHRWCALCGRDFAQGLDGRNDWQAVYVGLLRIETLADDVTKRWLSEECPRRFLSEDDEARARWRAI